MKVTLLDLDASRFPNLALMKLAAWHKGKGDSVALNFPLGADRGYASCVFSWHRDRLHTVPDTYQAGGAALNGSVLPSEIEHQMPDYDLYGLDYSLGFTSRGCPRHCDFCLVPRKEGAVAPWSTIYEFWDPAHQRIRLLDNNLLAAPNWRTTLTDIHRERIAVEFTQGLDIRLLTPHKAETLRRLKLWGELDFAFDDVAYERAVHKGIEVLRTAGFTISRLSFFLLFRPETHSANDFRRLQVMADYGVAVYPMFYTPLDAARKGWTIPRQHNPDVGIPLVRGPRPQFLKLIRLLAWKLARENEGT
ncbi:hypothetical protein LCGC14_1884300 [marine sediment metagenome]|uniref:Elp3/MiaA/NifB-like radical SAM core domain-containing protein n=1 Tax=marine sediment metagenome TaxID=412755 RepID=A0A0F9IFA2_9ZZZZ